MKRELFGLGVAILMVLSVLAFIAMLPQSPTYPWYNPQESLPHLPAPTSVPGEQVNETTIGSLSIGVTGFFSTMQPHVAPSTFDFTIDVTVNNTGTTPVTNFHVVKVTVFTENATPIYTFGVTPDSNLTIPDNSTWEKDYRNDRDIISIPASFFSSHYVFARLQATFDEGHEVILTTPLTMVSHAIE